MEAVVLAGGKGTRLQSRIRDVPKPMAPIAGRPFLEYVLTALKRRGLARAVLSVGYLGHVVREHFGTAWNGLEIDYAVEGEPLGTGGGIALALKEAKADTVAVLNGDTLFDVDLSNQIAVHEDSGADLTLALKPMTDFDRYGTVETDADGRITEFREKAYKAAGRINGGVYVMGRSFFETLSLPNAFSLETDVLQTRLTELRFQGFVSDGYFIDIGIPEDYDRAERELPMRFPELTESKPARG